MVTGRSPGGPACRLPRRTRTSPGLGGRLALELDRRRRASATVTVGPSAAWTIVRSTWENRSSPSRTKRGSALDADERVRGRPARPPRGPAWPSPPRRIRWPSWIPGRYIDLELRSARTRPPPPPASPRDARPCAPEPSQHGQGSAPTNWPKSFEPCCRSLPPSHAGRSRASVPGSAPLPSHGLAGDGDAEGNVPRHAAGGIDQLDRDLGDEVGAARRSRRRPATPKRSSPKNAENRSPASEVEAGRLEAAAAQTRVTEAVVQLPALGLERTSYASTTSLKRASASGPPTHRGAAPGRAHGRLS